MTLFHNRRGKHRLVAASLAALGCAAAMVWYGAKGEAAAVERHVPEAKLVRAMAVKPAPQADERIAIGEIRPRRESDLGFRAVRQARRSARPRSAQMVKKGEVLARIEDQDYRNRLPAPRPTSRPPRPCWSRPGRRGPHRGACWKRAMRRAPITMRR